jgi:hypothetical protein
LYTVKPVLTATSEQRPPVNNGRYNSVTLSINLTFIRAPQSNSFFQNLGAHLDGPAAQWLRTTARILKIYLFLPVLVFFLEEINRLIKKGIIRLK